MLHIHLFGHLRLFMDGRPHKFSALPKATPLLAYLLLHRNSHTPRDTLAYTLWPDVSESESRANLRRHLHELRRNLPPAPEGLPWIVAESQLVQWNPAAAAWVDVVEFESLSKKNDRLAEAAALYTGDLLQSIYEEWLEPERERFRSLHLHTLEQLIERCYQRGDLSQAVNYCQQALHYDPWRENIIRELMRLRLEAGDRAGALQEYQRFKQRLNEELGVAPMPETRLLHQEMVENRIKTPERPRLPAAAAPLSQPQQNLPAPLMACVGREAEIETLVRLYAPESSVRLVTLTGPGGIGKTRLALETASHLWQKKTSLFPDGVFFVPLANVQDTSLIAPAIAEAVGLKLTGGQSRWEQVKQYLQDKQLLLWLDNFEQLVTAAPELTNLLRAAAAVRLLVTSQALLHVYGEHEFAVPPLAVPQANGNPSNTEIGQTPAVVWFASVARTTNPSFTITAENAPIIGQICTRLDGLPLAIELAAARSKLFPPHVILAQLNNPLNFLTGRSRDLPARQRTLREAITWSYNLLNEPEKQLFAALSVFTGSFSLETAVTLAAAPSQESQVYNDLESLLDKNILRLATRPEEGEPRFRMLLVIREYAHELLAPETATVLRLCHAKIYRQLAETAQPALFGPAQADWIRRLKWEDDNFRAALTFLLTDKVSEEQAEMACGIAFSLAQRYWQMTGRLSEGRDWLNRILVHRALLTPFQSLLLLNHIGWFAQLQEDYATAIPRHEEALALARQLQDQLRLSQTLHYLGAAAGRTGDYTRSEELLSECLQLMRQDPTTSVASLSTILNNLGIVQRRLKKYSEAITTLNECRRLKEEQGDISGMASALSNLGMVSAEQEDYDAAAIHLRESLRLRQVSSDRMGTIFTLNNLASLACKQKYFIRAARLYGASNHLRDSMNIPDRVETASEIKAELDEIRLVIGEHMLAAAYQEGQNMSLDESIRYALSPETTDEAHPTVFFSTQSAQMITPTPGWRPSESTPFQIVQQELLAVGGMGEVYRGILAETGQPIVIKRLRPDLLANDPDLLVRFDREAEALRQLNHPNIVKIFATLSDPQDPQIIMEYVPGGSLRDLLDQEGQLPLARILRLGLELADALTRAHHLNIIHRDLKPANILLAEDGSVRLTDFGIAYLANQEQRLTQTGAVMGTAAYLSPEACLGDELDNRSDIWSFGVILAEMLTGKNPFVGGSFTATVSSVIHKPLPDLRPHRPDAPLELIRLIEQMLVKNRDERISSSRQVAAALDLIKS